MNFDAEKARSIFLTAVEHHAPNAWAAYLDEACAGDQVLRRRAEALLEAHMKANSLLDGPTLAATVDWPVPESPGTQIGPYKLLEQIGEGGMGTVFMAEQTEPVQRKVALKVIKAGMDSGQVIVRFEAERQALALMDHPNIAKVLDAGTTLAGRPYFVMELVKGVPITTYCDENHLPPEARLELFTKVCHAVQHAHQKGIIHRDLKPTNVLVTLYDDKPVPKVIDFGVAKATGGRLTQRTMFTGYGQIVGTLEYMSPEQARLNALDIDTRGDIYSLGVLLYELLTGTTPFDKKRLREAAFDEMLRMIREDEPPRPSARLSTAEGRASIAANRGMEPNRLSGMVRGELDWIVMKALEKDRNRRYETANGFAADVERYLHDEPVQACPPSAAYRLRKIVRKNKGPVLAAAVVVLALVAGIIGTTWGMLRATRAEAVAVDALQGKEAALANAKDKLWLSLYEQARARRNSRKMGQRLESLDALAKAARLRPDERLRDEATAAMALPDVRLGPSWQAWPPGQHGWSFDAHYRLHARFSDRGVISVRSIPDDREIQSIEGTPIKFPFAWVSRFSPGGEYLGAFEHGNGPLRVWRVSDGTAMLRDEPPQTWGWAFSSDNCQLAIGKEGWVIRFDLATGQELNRWELPDKATAYHLAFHPDNRRVAVAYVGSGIVSVFEATKGDLVANLPVGETYEPQVAWHPDGERLAVSGVGESIQIWNVAAIRKLATLEGHVQHVTSLSFHPDCDLLSSYSWDGTVRLWNPSTARELMQFSSTNLFLQFSNDGRWLGITQHGERGQILEVTPSREYRTLVSGLGAGQGGYTRDSDISPEGRLLALNMNDAVRLWDLTNGRELAVLPPGRPLFQSNTELLIAGPGGVHRLPIQPNTAANERRLGPPRTIALPATPTRAERSPDGRTLAIVTEANGTGLLVDLTTDSVRALRFEHALASFVALSRDGRWLATSGWHSDQVRLWNAETGNMVHEWVVGSPAQVFFTPDSQALIISRGDEFSFHDVQTLKPIRRIRRDVAQFPGHVAFSPDGGLMALEMAPGIVHLKDSATNRTVAKLEDPHGDRAGWMSFTPAGSQLVVVAPYAKAVHVWDLGLTRQRLKGMDLDWEWPEFKPAGELRSPPAAAPHVVESHSCPTVRQEAPAEILKPVIRQEATK